MTVRPRSAHTLGGPFAAQTCPEDFIPFFVESDEGCIDYDAYVDTMAQDHKWGTHIEATAISKGLGLPVRIFRADPRVSHGNPFCRQMRYTKKCGAT